MSKIFYKFKSQDKHSTIIFDGMSISVADTKREILLQQKLDGKDFDLELMDAASEALYLRDNDLITRNASLTVRRVPAKGPAAASRYLEATVTMEGNQKRQAQPVSMPVFSLPMQQSAIPGLSRQPQVQEKQELKGDTEADRIRAFQEQSTSQFEQKFQVQAQPGNPRQTIIDPSKPPPSTYTCHRCGVKGHYINFCPTMNNPLFDNIKVKKTTGIPRSFLTTVGQVSDVTGEATLDLDDRAAKSVMVTPYGDVVVVQVNDSQFNAQLQRSNVVVMNEEQLRDKCMELEKSQVEAPGYFMKPELVCPIDHVLFREASRVECCGTKYCYSCIHDNLSRQAVNGVIKCPNCQRIIYMESIITDKPSRALVDRQLRLVGDYVKENQKLQAAMVNAKKQVILTEAPENLPVHQKLNFAEIQRLRMEPRFELVGEQIPVEDLTEDRSRIYDGKYHERLSFEISRQYLISTEQHVHAAPHFRAQEWERDPPSWNNELHHRSDMTDINEFVIKIDGQDFRQHQQSSRHSRPRSRSPPPPSRSRDYRSRSRRDDDYHREPSRTSNGYRQTSRDDYRRDYDRRDYDRRDNHRRDEYHSRSRGDRSRDNRSRDDYNRRDNRDRSRSRDRKRGRY